ncbi:restriction endonuclease [Pseudomonas sp. Y5-11]|jgi:restriction system protein|uniref:restriction endonuclease n=1 Tax=Pseudomonas TaxID=286 RepID=UPI00103E82E7|nr:MULTISPECIES: restriction endonuclease [Pseudomonas]QXE12584.1 restriction endonuclease [Pseudomonas sp. AN-B15]ULN81102.1 restriction endonuclease [Pseudomonas sp. Y5-11]
MAMNFSPGVFADHLSEIAGQKVGLALSVPELCDHLSGDHRNLGDVLLKSEKAGLRIRSEEFEAVCYRLLHRIGYTEGEENGIPPQIKLYHKYKHNPRLLAIYEGVSEIFNEMMMDLIEETTKGGGKSLDPSQIMKRCAVEFDRTGLDMAMEHINGFDHHMRISLHTLSRCDEWATPLELKALFSGTLETPERGTFIDQRFINYLSNNDHRLGEMHWRKFEELTAEYFERDGFRVEIGPGTNDDGVDVRLWKPETLKDAEPTCLIQCKRQKAKIEKVIIKGLAADVQFMGADYGMIVTTSELSPGAQTTISARGYPIQVVERDAVKTWLTRLRTPGTGIVRI